MIEALLVLDRLTRVAPLGLRFWDAATESFVAEGLSVTATPRCEGPCFGRTQSAFPNRSGVYVFQHLPGLHEVEAGAGDATYWDSPPATREFVVTVKDGLRRFLPFRFTVQAPAQGIYDWRCSISLPLAPLPRQPEGTVPLFSAPERPTPAGLAAVRACLVTGPQEPAARAFVEAYCQGELLSRGITDAAGRVVLYFPYPRFIEPSPPEHPPALARRTWPIELRACFERSQPFPDSPDLCEVVDQVEVAVLGTISPPTPLGAVALQHGRELIIVTQHQSELWIA